MKNIDGYREDLRKLSLVTWFAGNCLTISIVCFATGHWIVALLFTVVAIYLTRKLLNLSDRFMQSVWRILIEIPVK